MHAKLCLLVRLLKLLKRDVLQGKLEPLKVRPRLQTLLHFWRDLMDRLRVSLRGVSPLPSQRAPSIPFLGHNDNDRSRLIQLGAELIELRLETGDFDGIGWLSFDLDDLSRNAGEESEN